MANDLTVGKIVQLELFRNVTLNPVSPLVVSGLRPLPTPPNTPGSPAPVTAIDSDNLDLVSDQLRPYMVTDSGKRFYLLEPTADQVDPRDLIAHTCRIPRFTGACGRDYSVGHHSVLVCWVVEALGGTKADARAGLIHDLPEAYTNDLSSPMKLALKILGFDMKKFTRPIETAVSERFGVAYPWPDIVREADRIALDLEWNAMFLAKTGQGLGFSAGRGKIPAKVGNMAQELKALMEYGSNDRYTRIQDLLECAITNRFGKEIFDVD